MSRLRAMAGCIRQLAAPASWWVMAHVGYWFAAGDTRACTTETIQGQCPLGTAVCIFVHFDRHGIIRDHTRTYMEALAQQGLSLIFVTNSGYLEPNSLDYALHSCSQVILRKNRGYDFGAYRDAIRMLAHDLDRFDAIFVANDSVYGPIGPLQAFFDRLNFAEADVWAATDSWQQRYHLQSYLVAFGRNAMANPAFLQFWQDVRNVRSKYAAVRYYEIGLTQRLQAAGLRCAAVWDYQTLIRSVEDFTEADEPHPDDQPLARIVKSATEAMAPAARARIALNPTHELWLILLWHNYPFLKRQLVLHNPNRISDISVWHRIVQSRAPRLYDAVIEDLKQAARHTAP